MTRPCRTPDCQRTPRPHYAYCDRCVLDVVDRAYVPTPRETAEGRKERVG